MQRDVSPLRFGEDRPRRGIGTHAEQRRGIARHVDSSPAHGGALMGRHPARSCPTSASKRCGRDATVQLLIDHHRGPERAVAQTVHRLQA
jgi:hypothetical protein